ncbi:DUF2207 domain-containing protein [Microbacterium sp. SA39]|uniref:DUF2207 domain-containing protein n=1 Tax=Microbacterium sp. SA39 TaxID=1263625 RepID=UPI0005FA9095|nr:DUF2207 domain-containing protein [Microbacterium sp. SA39]KJQ53404.1 hypothetical protein RS85_02921 [Microbacterium sp. SA39]
MTASRIIRATAVLILTLSAVSMPTAAVALSADAAGSAAAQTDVDDFSYASWDALYEVGVDDEGRARMNVTETLVARFPEYDQNRGIVRGLPTSYQNAGIDTRVLSVTDEAGVDVPFETDEEDGLLLILTGDDDYVQGLTTYVIEYEMRDVVLAAGATRGSRGEGTGNPAVDEFYWDLLPLDSTQPIERFRADIVFDAAMSERLAGSASCYAGVSGSTDTCDLEGPVIDGDRAMFRVESGERPAGDGVTVAIGFEPATVVQPSARTPNPVTDTLPWAAAIGAAGLSVGAWLSVSAFKRRRGTATGVIVAQYDVPDSMPPLLAAAIVPGAKDVIPAEIVHLAVRGTLRIEEGGSPENPRLRRIAGSRISDQLDVEALDALFLKANEGGVVDVPRASESFAGRMSALVQSGKTAAQTRGLTTTARSRGAAIVQWIAIAVAVAGLGLSLAGVISGRISAVPALVAGSFGVVLVLIASWYSFSKHTVLTPEGARELEHLKGVEEFIRVAEADRLRMLQSYSGAERRQEGTADVIHVYERLLPYAMLFGMEKEWGDVLERAYSAAQRGPGWIGDPSTPYLGVYLSSFTSSSHAAAAYTSPSAGTSSSSGGSFGGGFSGGGGGGGFSGGR